jgi:hypothetical protein
MTLVTDRPFNSKARTADDDIGAEGWSASEEWNRSRISIVSDAAAPVSPTSVARHHWAKGDRSGTSYSRQDVAISTPRTTIFIGTAMKVSENFYGHPGSGATKFVFIWEARNNANAYVSVSGVEMGPLRLEYFLQGAGATPAPIARRLSPNVGDGSIIRGRWHRIEMILVGNSKTCVDKRSDGELHIWIDGRKTHQYKDVCHDQDAGAKFRRAATYAMWGGQGGEVPYDMYSYWDHFHISGR